MESIIYSLAGMHHTLPATAARLSAGGVPVTVIIRTFPVNAATPVAASKAADVA